MLNSIGTYAVNLLVYLCIALGIALLFSQSVTTIVTFMAFGFAIMNAVDIRNAVGTVIVVSSEQSNVEKIADALKSEKRSE